MLTEKEKQFLVRWPTVRVRESSFKHKLLAGLPMALMFALPILIFFAVVKIFFPSWFTTASHKQAEIVTPELTERFMKLSAGDIMAAFVAVLIVVLFFSYFRMQYKWEMNEQLYQELKNAEKKEQGAA
jgi:membrane protease YdiL (CAAX protease family)